MPPSVFPLSHRQSPCRRRAGPAPQGSAAPPSLGLGNLSRSGSATVVEVDNLSGDIDALITVENLGALENEGKFFVLRYLAYNFIEISKNDRGHFVFPLAQLRLGILHDALICHDSPVKLLFQIPSLFVFHQRTLFIVITLLSLDLRLFFQQIRFSFFHLRLKVVFGLLPRLRLHDRPLNIDEADLDLFLCPERNRKKQHETNDKSLFHGYLQLTRFRKVNL